ncbi:MAG: response regulator [Pseudomonadota bacterium]
MAGGSAHDFNNLLTIISGYAELGLAENKEGQAGYEELGIVLNAAGRGADLVKQILTFSREVETKPKPTNLNHQVEHAEKLLYKTIPKMIEIRSDLADDLKVVMVDPTQIEQILLNLAVNARDAMPEGGTLTFKTENSILDVNYCRFQPDVQPGEYAALTISDTGQGMESEILDRIFEPFYSTKKAGEGTGLGLAMVFGIVKNHRGHITCHSEPGMGTTFKIYFPVVTEDKVKPEVLTSGEFDALGTETILLVDDEDLIADLAKRILTKSGYRVLTASNGQEALQVYRKEQAVVSLVIVDMIMPVMGGKECLNELLRINPDVKVIVASGFTPDAETKEAIEVGAIGFVSKPFQVDEILKAVREALDE